ncbi:MAG: AhpC/TSA family protein [Bacteroidetes bacterium]|nr:MAG: AhpC/TSA family protein [Bacteroidota bacterium]
MQKLVLIPLLIVCLNILAQEKPEGLFIYSKAPDFKSKDQNGNEIALKDLRKKASVVLVFYRGYWCTYCNKELQRFEDSLQLINDGGAQLIAVTPEKQDGIAKTVERTKASFPIITDEEMKIMKAYDVAYQVDGKTVARYKMASIDLAANNGQKADAVYLPIPAVYIINKQGEITYRYFDSDYRKRPYVKEILENLKGLK